MRSNCSLKTAIVGGFVSGFTTGQKFYRKPGKEQLTACYIGGVVGAGCGIARVTGKWIGSSLRKEQRSNDNVQSNSLATNSQLNQADNSLNPQLAGSEIKINVSSHLKEELTKATISPPSTSFSPLIISSPLLLLNNNEKAHQQQFANLLRNHDFWKSKSHFSFSVSDGIKQMQNLNCHSNPDFFKNLQAIARARLNKGKSLFYLFTGYDSRDNALDLFYRAIVRANSFAELFVDASFTNILQKASAFPQQHLQNSTTQLVAKFRVR